MIRTDNSKVIADLIEENERLKEAIKEMEEKDDKDWNEILKENQQLKKLLAEIIPSIHRRGKPVDGSEGEE
jgi:cell shape-determining protein MreC